MKRLIIFSIIFSIIILSSLVISVESETEIGIQIPGCDLGDEKILANSCSTNGEYFCDSNSNKLYTKTDEKGCSLGGESFNLGNPQCCPSGYVCEGDSLSLDYLTCVQRTTNCAEYQDINNCQGNSCFWIEVGSNSFCADKPSDYGCSVYTNEDECNSDFLNLGQVGFGTGDCASYFSDEGKNYVSPKSSCKCEWDKNILDDLTDDVCEFSFTVTSDIYGFNDVADAFSCERKFEAGFCIDGFQDVTWKNEYTLLSGWLPNPPGISQTLIDTVACDPFKEGSITRTCGDPIITLPGFSSFAFLLSIGIISLFYIFRREIE